MKRSSLFVRAGALLLALMLALFMVACGSDDNGDNDPGAQPAETEQTEPEETEDAPGAAGAQVAVTATEFEFTGIEETMPAGETTFSLVNDGKQPHEFLLFGLNEDAPPLDKLLKMSQKEAEKFFAGPPESAFAKPGESMEEAFTVELASGSHYAYVCFVEDKKTKQPHAFLGMVGEFTVE
jgi:uncharacterized cupredoxin-like copper-binding protein